MEPMLRFKADDGSNFPDWKEKALSEIAARVTRKNNGNQTDIPLTISSRDGLVDQRDYFKKTVASKDMSGYFLLRNGEFAYNKSYSVGFDYGSIKRLDKYPCGALSTLYICFGLKPNVKVDSGYLAHYFDSQKWNPEVAAICAEGARNHGLLNVPTADFFDINIAVPSFPEQRKIADFLSAVDDAITAQKAEVTAWEKRKKGVMQKLFNQEIRFKSDDGSDFPDWEEKTLGDICMYERQRSEGANFVGTENMLKDFGGVTFDNSNADGSGTLYHPGDTLMSNIRPYLKKAWLADRKGTCSTDVLVFHPTSVEPGYLYWLIASDAFVRYVMSAVKGLKMPRGDKKHIMEMPLLLPNKDEQHKIDDCLSSLNDVIIKTKNELAKWQELKKGLLQQMFV